MAAMKLELGPLGFGAFKIGRNAGTKYDRAYELPDPAACARLLNSVLDLGIHYIDTAPAYGVSEERIGQSIAHRRGEYLLSTKVGEFFENGQSRHDFSRAAVEASVQGSLRRLRTEAVDILWIHASHDDARMLRETDVVETMVSLRRSGMARAIGLSGYTAEAFRATFEWADAMMVAYHRDDASMAEVMAEAAERGLSVVVKKGLESGRIPPSEAIPFILGHPAVTSMVVGSLSLDHLRENLVLASAAGETRP